MSFSEALAMAGAQSRGKRPYFFKDPDVERVLSITMAVAGELAVMRARLDTVERLLEAKGSVSRDDIEAFSPGEEAAAERGRWTEEYMARILRILQQEREAVARPDEESAEQLSDEFART